MPSVESHVKECVKVLGEEHRDLCYMVNSWMDAPSRRVGAAHRVYRHDPVNTPIEACKIYGETVNGAVLVFSPINDIITFIVRQHLVLDGLLPPTDPIFSRAPQIEGATSHLSYEVAARVRNTIQGLENKLNTMKKDITLASLILLFALFAYPFLFFNLFGGDSFALFMLFLMSPLFIIIIGFPFFELFSTIRSYRSCEDTYRKIKEQEENGQIKCPACEKKTAVLVKKQNSTFAVCKRCGFAWRSNDFVARRMLVDFLSIWSPDQLEESQLQALYELYHYFPGETIDLLQDLKANAESSFKKAKDKEKRDYYRKELQLWSYLIEKIQRPPK